MGHNGVSVADLPRLFAFALDLTNVQRPDDDDAAMEQVGFGGDMDLGLTGFKVILIGGSRGIGRATAEVFAAEGCNLAISARGAEPLAEAKKDLEGRHGRPVFTGVADTANGPEYTTWLESAVEHLGGCDIFVSFACNGGEDTEEGWRQILNSDLLAVWRASQVLRPYLEKSQAGSIVIISSTAALEEFLGPLPYNAIKAACINYAHALSQAFAGNGVRVNTVSPGPIWVDGGAWQAMKDAAPEVYESTLKAIPMGRMGQADEVARAIAFVAAPVCRFMTGANIVIDGGFTKGVRY